VNELSRHLAVTRTAVRQHLAALMRDGFVGVGATPPSGGARSSSTYSPMWAGGVPAPLLVVRAVLIDAMAREHGATGLRARLGRSLPRSRRSCRDRVSETKSWRQKCTARRADGRTRYDAPPGRDVGGAPTIEATNCVSTNSR